VTSSKHSSLSRREKYLIFMVFAALFFTVFLKLGGFAFFNEIETLRAEKKARLTLIEELDRMLESEKVINEKWAAVQSEQSSLERIIPDLADQPGVFGSLETLLQNSPGSLAALRVPEQVNCGRHSTLSLNATVKELPALPKQLLDSLADFPHLLIIEQLIWEQNDDQQGSIKLTMKIYFLN
jgi:hypothetical protein